MDYPFAGSRMLRALLGRAGIRIGRLHVPTLMTKMGIATPSRRFCKSRAPSYRTIVTYFESCDFPLLNSCHDARLAEC